MSVCGRPMSSASSRSRSCERSRTTQGIAARTQYVVDLETAVFGAIPTVELQSAFNVADTGFFDVTLVAVYLT